MKPPRAPAKGKKKNDDFFESEAETDPVEFSDSIGNEYSYEYDDGDIEEDFEEVSEGAENGEDDL